MAQSKTLLDYVYDHEGTRPNHVFLTQPTGGGAARDYTWAQMMGEARRMATHLKAQNLEPGSRIAMLAKNSAHFFMAEVAIWMAGHTTVAIFPTESADNVKFVLEHSGASMLFIGKLDTWKAQKSAVPASMPCIEMPLAPDTGFEKWDAIVARNQPIAGKPAQNEADIALLMYTSGSTGQPKGVMHSFKGATAAAVGMGEFLAQNAGTNYDHRVLSYLPLAHVFERACIEFENFRRGNGHVFFAESLDTFVADMQRARPTVFVSVPRLWLKFQQGVNAKMPAAKLDRLLKLPIIGKIVGKKVLKGLGLDQVRQANSGSAPIPPMLIDWYRRLGLNLLEGYGMTEDFAYSHGSSLAKSAAGHVGIPMPGVKARISPEGEVQINSPGKLVGYYKRPDLDAEAFTEDGYFKTGDLGEIKPDGQLKITGRIKELFKTGKGKYVAPAPIENKLNENGMIEMSLVSGVGQQAAYAMVVLNEQLRPKQNDPAVRAEVEAELGALLKSVNKNLTDYEQLRMIVVAQEPWSIENGCLTPTMKIKRARIETVVGPDVDKWFNTKGAVLWA